MNKLIKQIIFFAIVVFLGMAQFCSIAIAVDTNPNKNKTIEQKRTIDDLRFRFVNSNGTILKNTNIYLLAKEHNSLDLTGFLLDIDNNGISVKQEAFYYPPKLPINITFLKKNIGFAKFKNFYARTI